MTISSTTVKNSYSGDGSTTTFSYTFKIFADSDIQVIIRSSTGTETTKTITTHYTVTGAGSSGGGSVIFTSGNIPTATQTVVLRRNIPQTQAIDYIANDPFPAESHEEGLDRATMAIQQLQEEVTRSIKLSKTNTMTSTEFTVGASDRANKILAFDTNGELAVTQELGTNRGNWATATTFNGRDIVKDSSNNNIYLCNTTHTSTGTTPISSNADVAKWDLIVDAASATNSANSASNSASNSSNSANTSANHASNSANHASNSSNFANNSSNSANSASTYLAGVAANASNSSNFANNSSNSANSAANHSSNASNFANNSSNSANSSSNHSANSSNFANNSSNSANSASASATTATTQAGYASSNAATATTQAGYATSNATAALGYSSNSSNFANNSSNFANTASNAANAANAARDAALVAADNFDDVYLGSKTTDPTLDNDGAALTAGDLYYNSIATVLKYYTGSAWVAITSGGITDLVQDTTPQLGGALDVNTFSITSTSNGNITLQPNGTGDVVLSADTVKIGDSNTDAVLTTDGTGDITISTNSGTNSGTVKIFDGVNGNIEITPNGSGVVKLDGLSYPTADGTANQVLKTNGSGVLSFATPSAGFSGATTTSSAVDITLTSASTQVQNIAMTAVDKSVILPDATTLTTKGFPIFVIVNNGVYNFSIKNNSGYTIATSTANTSTELTLIDNSTSGGVFATDGNAINLSLSPITTVKSGTTGISTTHAHTNPWNFGVTIDKLTSTSAIIFYVAGTSNRDIYGVVVSYSGTTITVNSETLLYSGSSTAATCFTSVTLDSTTGLIIVGRTSNKIAVPFTISGTTITAGTASATFGTGTGSAGGFSKPVAASSTLACLFDNTVTDGLIFKLRTIQHNGASAPTIGTASTGTITMTYDEAPPTLSPISATEVFIAYPNTANLYTIARIGTLSGTSAPVLETANTSQANNNTYDMYTAGIKKISSTEFYYIGTVGFDRYTVSGTTVTFVSHSPYITANNLIPNYYNSANISFGNFALKLVYNNSSLHLLEKVGDTLYAKQNYLVQQNYYSYNDVNYTSTPIELDSTTVMFVSNNGGTGSKISAYLVKYIGA
jgi:trimeric autotransporter adhesin